MIQYNQTGCPVTMPTIDRKEATRNIVMSFTAFLCSFVILRSAIGKSWVSCIVLVLLGGYIAVWAYNNLKRYFPYIAKRRKR
jgi:heme O synthase-like polyprenyltransferase